MKMYALIAIATSAIVVLALCSMAAADPGGWAVWRVALTAWPFGLVAGGFAIVFYRIEER